MCFSTFSLFSWDFRIIIKNLELVLIIVGFNYNLDIHDNNNPIPYKVFGIPKCALLIVHLKHVQKIA